MVAVTAMPPKLTVAATNKATATTKTLLFSILIIIVIIISNLCMHGNVIVERILVFVNVY